MEYLLSKPGEMPSIPVAALVLSDIIALLTSSELVSASTKEEECRFVGCDCGTGVTLGMDLANSLAMFTKYPFARLHESSADESKFNKLDEGSGGLVEFVILLMLSHNSLGLLCALLSS